jgi:hypothetical protein
MEGGGRRHLGATAFARLAKPKLTIRRRLA